jgi:hypothetical protein
MSYRPDTQPFVTKNFTSNQKDQNPSNRERGANEESTAPTNASIARREGARETASGSCTRASGYLTSSTRVKDQRQRQAP